MANKEVYPFREFLEEDKSRYKTATEAGYYDPYNNFLIGDSGGFLMNIRRGRFVNTNLFTAMADTYLREGKYTIINQIVFHIDNFVEENVIDVKMVLMRHAGLMNTDI